MSREEREALLETETPDLPEHPSPVQTGTRRLVGIIIVSLIISAAVSVSLILTLTAGLPDRIKRDVLAELQGEKEAAKAERLKDVVLVYVPADCRYPLASDPAEQAANATTTAVLEEVVTDEKVQDTAWYAANAQRPVEALREALKVTVVPRERFLAFHSDAIPAADRELILRRCAESYIEIAAKVGQMPLQNRLRKALQSREKLTHELDAAEAEFVRLSDSGKVQLGLSSLHRRAQPASTDLQSANRMDATRASLQGERCMQLRDRLNDLDAEIALLKVRMTDGVDPQVPRTYEFDGLAAVPEDCSLIEDFVTEAPHRAELDVLRQRLAVSREDAKTLTDRMLKHMKTVAVSAASLRNEVMRAFREQVELESAQEAVRQQAAEAEATTQPASQPTTRPADAKATLAELAGRITAARENVAKAVRRFQDGWKLQRETARFRAAVDGKMHVIDAMERRMTAVDLNLATTVVGKVVWEKD